MSTWSDRTATCPECGQTTPARIATSVHIARVPEVRAAVFDRSFNRITCAACGRRIAIDAAFTYVDVERGHWVQVEPVARRSDWRKVEQITMRALTRGLDVTSPLVTELAATARRRVVFGTEELREKLIVWNVGLDDELLECIKLRAAIDDISLVDARLIADRVTDDGGLELVRVDGDEPHPRYAVPASWVDRALDEQPSLQTRFPELFGGGFVNVLRLMAIALLFIVSCSQPSRPEQPPPRPNDVALVAPQDAETQGPDDAALEVPQTSETQASGAPDAAPPLDAPREVGWESLRRADISADSMKVAAVIIGTSVDGREVVIHFDRGKYAGVHEGWRGKLVDDYDHPVPVEFAISSVTTRTSTARATAYIDQVRRNSHAVLWNPEYVHINW
jgi:hypothetical protein